MSPGCFANQLVNPKFNRTISKSCRDLSDNEKDRIFYEAAAAGEKKFVAKGTADICTVLPLSDVTFSETFREIGASIIEKLSMESKSHKPS